MVRFPLQPAQVVREVRLQEGARFRAGDPDPAGDSRTPRFIILGRVPADRQVEARALTSTLPHRSTQASRRRSRIFQVVR